MSMSAAPVFAQAAPELPPEGGYTLYPDYAEVDCEAGEFNGSQYTGQIKQIEALDDYTVAFTLCAPDGGAFLSKVAFSAFGIQDADYLRENAGTGVLRDQPNGTGPYKLGEWRQGEEVILVANEDYWGDPALTPTAVLRWSSEPGQKLIELQSGNADAIDNPSVDDLPTIEADENLELLPRGATNVFYLGMNNLFTPFDNQKIRQGVALGVDKQSIVDQFYPPGSKTADYFTPCEIAFGCEGEPWPAFDPEAGRALIAEGLEELGLEEFPEVPLSLRVVDRSYLPFPEQVAQELQNQLQENLGIPTFIDVQESGTFIANAYAPNLPGFHLLGWNADYPEITNFLDFHFGAGAGPQFGDLHPEITEPLTVGATNTDPEIRAQAYADANNAIREIVPMVPIATGNSYTAWAAGIEGAQSSPISNEQFSVVDTGDDDFVFVQNGQPISFYCADESDGESLRACEQVQEPLYGFEINGTAPVPLLAEACEPNETFDVWTCTLREGVTFHDGSDLTAQDVVTTYAHMWDTLNPMHDPLSSLYYYMSLWNGFLNPPASE
jgi:ABC-type transport system substrate-binding protein